MVGNVPGNQGTSTKNQDLTPRHDERSLMALFRKDKHPDVRKPATEAADPRIYGRHYTGPSPWFSGLLVAV